MDNQHINIAQLNDALTNMSIKNSRKKQIKKPIRDSSSINDKYIDKNRYDKNNKKHTKYLYPFNTILNEESYLFDYKLLNEYIVNNEINIIPYGYQLNSLNAMVDLELNPVRNFDNKHTTTKMLIKQGLLSDSFGSGKSITLLLLILLNKPKNISEFYSLQHGSTEDGSIEEFNLRKKYKRLYQFTIIICGPTKFREWINEIKKFGKLTVYGISSIATLDKFIQMLDDYINFGIEINFDIILIKNGKCVNSANYIDYFHNQHEIESPNQIIGKNYTNKYSDDYLYNTYCNKNKLHKNGINEVYSIDKTNINLCDGFMTFNDYDDYCNNIKETSYAKLRKLRYKSIIKNKTIGEELYDYSNKLQINIIDVVLHKMKGICIRTIIDDFDTLNLYKSNLTEFNSQFIWYVTSSKNKHKNIDTIKLNNDIRELFGIYKRLDNGVNPINLFSNSNHIYEYFNIRNDKALINKCIQMPLLLSYLYELSNPFTLVGVNLKIYEETKLMTDYNTRISRNIGNCNMIHLMNLLYLVTKKYIKTTTTFNSLQIFINNNYIHMPMHNSPEARQNINMIENINIDDIGNIFNKLCGCVRTRLNMNERNQTAIFINEETYAKIFNSDIDTINNIVNELNNTHDGVIYDKTFALRIISRYIRCKFNRIKYSDMFNLIINTIKINKCSRCGDDISLHNIIRLNQIDSDFICGKHFNPNNLGDDNETNLNNNLNHDYHSDFGIYIRTDINEFENDIDNIIESGFRYTDINTINLNNNEFKPNDKTIAIINVIQNKLNLNKEKIRIEVPGLMEGINDNKYDENQHGKRKFIIFVDDKFNERQIEYMLKKYNINFCLLQGTVNNKYKNITDFWNEKQCIIINTDNDSSGFNLQCCTDIIYTCKIQNKDFLAQSIGRGYRHGRKCNLDIHFVVYDSEKPEIIKS